MKPIDDIDKLIKKLHVAASADLDKKVHGDISKALEESKKQQQAVRRPIRGTHMPRSRITKLAAAAVVIFAVGVGILSTLDHKRGEDIRQGATGSGPGQGGYVDSDNIARKTAELEAELKLVEEMFAAGDIDGLAAMLSRGEFETKVAAAKCLAEIGDLDCVAVLAKLDSEYGSISSVFAEAMEAIESSVTDANTEGAGVVFAPNEPAATAGSAGGEQGGDELLRLVPAESLFCVRVNNLDYTFGLMDQFLAGVSPVPAATTMAARMQLAGVLGDPALTGVNTGGDFAIFGVLLPGEPNNGPMDNMFVGELIPVTDYAKFVSENPNCGEADANGISVIKSGGTADPGKTSLVVQRGGYALVGRTGDYGRFVSAAKLISADIAGLGDSPAAGEAASATKDPIWVYGNVQRASKVFGPLVTGKLEEIKRQIEKMNADSEKPMGPPAAIMNIYFGMLDILMEEVEFVRLSIRPQAHVFNLTVGISAVPGTYMAKMFAGDPSSEAENKLLGYLQDGAVFNLGLKKNRPLWEEWSLTEFDMLSFLSDNDISGETLARLEKLVAEGIASVSGPGVISFVFDEKAQSPFAFRFLVEVEDAAMWDKVIEGWMDLWDTGGFVEIARNLGIEQFYELKRGVDSYNGVSIDAAKLSLKAVDPNSEYGKMIDKIYAGGFNYRWATVGRLWVGTLGCDRDSAKDEQIHKLIDRVQAGAPPEIASEMKAALASLTEAEGADFVGTYNFVRYLKVIGKVTELTGGIPGGIPQIDVPTESNIAFAGRINNGKIAVEIALPKGHLMELKTAVEMVQMVMASRQRAAAQIAPEGFNIEEPVGGKLLAGGVVSCDEETAIEGLRSFAELTGAQYPSDLGVMTTVMKEAGEALRRKILSDPNREPNAPPSKEEFQKLANVESTCLFYTKLVRDGNDVAYYGDMVTTEFGDAVLMRWKIGEDSYRVVFGDLSTDSVTAEELTELESRPLNTRPQAIKPAPADGGVASTVVGLQLSWMPGISAEAHRVYLGTEAENLLLLVEVTDSRYSELPGLETGITYYWRIDEVDADGSIAVGDVWNFKTGRLLGWWKFDDGLGSVAKDSSGNGNDGILKNMDDSDWIGTAGGFALDFDGKNDCVQTSLDIDQGGSSSITMAAWVYPKSANCGKHHVISSDNVYWDWSLLRRGDKWCAFTGDGEWDCGHIVEVDKWQHVAVVFKAGEDVVFYKDANGIWKGSAPVTDEIDNNICIGDNPGQWDEYFEGLVDDVRVYNYALSQEEIAAIYDSTRPTLVKEGEAEEK